MKAKEAMRSPPRASPWIMPMKKTMVGARNCRKPMLDRGMRRAAQANRARGMTVAGPANSSQKVAAGLSVKCPCPVAWI
ncbi:hypothetical protein D3C73_1611780 [compost metagenome]